MSNFLVKTLDQSEQDKLVTEAYQHPDVSHFIKKLQTYGVIKEGARADILSSIEYSPEDAVINLLTMGFNDGEVKVFYVRLNDNKVNVKGAVKKVVNGKEMLYDYRMVNGELEVISSYEYDDQFQALVQEFNQNNTLPTHHEEDFTAQAVPCLHGNWCGPGCSGPAAPITSVDKCCQLHDLCYGQQGYFSCICDLALTTCLRPYVAAGSEWAILIDAYYGNLHVCNPF